MTKETLTIRRRDIILGTILAASLSPALLKLDTDAKTPTRETPYPQEIFSPVIINYNELNYTQPMPKSEPPIEHNQPLSKEKKESADALPKNQLAFQKLASESAIPPSWTLDKEISWYGPNFYGKRTACGLELTKDLLGVAHRDLPCGTLVAFKWEDKQITVPVVDRGPYVDGRIFDLTGGTCVALDHCFTGPINYRIEK